MVLLWGGLAASRSSHACRPGFIGDMLKFGQSSSASCMSSPVRFCTRGKASSLLTGWWGKLRAEVGFSRKRCSVTGDRWPRTDAKPRSKERSPSVAGRLPSLRERSGVPQRCSKRRAISLTLPTLGISNPVSILDGVSGKFGVVALLAIPGDWAIVGDKARGDARNAGRVNEFDRPGRGADPTGAWRTAAGA